MGCLSVLSAQHVQLRTTWLTINVTIVSWNHCTCTERMLVIQLNQTGVGCYDPPLTHSVSGSLLIHFHLFPLWVPVGISTAWIKMVHVCITLLWVWVSRVIWNWCCTPQYVLLSTDSTVHSSGPSRYSLLFSTVPGCRKWWSTTIDAIQE